MKYTLFKSFIIVALFIIINPIKIVAKDLSENSVVSLLTCSPGNDLYSQFGHSAIRFKDPENRIDLVFNYGTFNFNDPNFYVKFARGKLKYRLAYDRFPHFKSGYIREGRGITEQVLNLDLNARQKLFDAIIENYKPENRYYHYDFLFDNCSTRIRDLIEQKCNIKLVYHLKETKTTTFWNLLDEYMYKSKWIYTGIHIILGIPCDTKATPYQYMFLPDYLMYAYDDAKIESNGKLVPLVQSKTEILDRTLLSKPTAWYQSPITIFTLLALLGLLISILTFRKRRNHFAFDILLFSISGLIGWVIIFLWFFTDHQATGPNWNILWACPLHFPFIFTILKRKKKFIKKYSSFFSIYYLILLAVWAFIPQSFANELLPIIALLFIRSFYISKKLHLKK